MIPLVVLGVGAALVLLFIGLSVHHATEEVKPAKLAYRVATGLMPDGKTKRDPMEKASRWRLLARWQRFIITWAIAAGYFGVAYEWLAHPGPVGLLLRVVLAVVLGLLMIRAGLRAKTYSHRKVHVRPQAEHLAHALHHHPSHITPGMFVAPDIDRVEPGGVAARHRLPEHRTNSTSQRTLLMDIWANHFGTDDLEARWTSKWGTHWLEVLRTALPPKYVLLADHADNMDVLPIGRYLLGLGLNNTECHQDARTEDPHVAVQAQSTRGKTNTLSGIVAQGNRRGELFTLIDPKGTSFGHFAGVPGIKLANDPANSKQMVELICAFETEMRAAIKAGKRNPAIPHTLVIDEMNALFSLVGGAKKGVLARNNPVAVAISAVLNMGAAFGYRLIVSGQDLSDEALFGARNRIGTFVMMGYKPAQWTNIVGTVPIPPEPTRKGLAYVVKYGVPELVQMVWPGCDTPEADETIWRQYALGDREPEPVPVAVPEADDAGSPDDEWEIVRSPLGPEPAPEPDVDTGDPDAELAEMTRIIEGNKGAAEFLGTLPGTFIKRWQKYPIPAAMELETVRINGNDIRRWMAADLRQWWESTSRRSKRAQNSDSNDGNQGGN